MSRWMILVWLVGIDLVPTALIDVQTITGPNRKESKSGIEIVFDPPLKAPANTRGNSLCRNAPAQGGVQRTTEKTIEVLVGPKARKIRVLFFSKDWSKFPIAQGHVRKILAAQPKTVYRYQAWAEAVPPTRRIIATIEYENGKSGDLEIAGNYLCFQDLEGVHWWVRLTESFERCPQPKFLLSWGMKGDKPGEFYSPIGIAINKKDEVFVTDLNNARLQRFTAKGQYLGGFDLPRDDPKRKSSQAGGIALDDNGHIYLSYMAQHKIGVYTYEGKFVREWGKKGAAAGEFNQPGGIALAPDGSLYVCDQCNHRVQKFTTAGKFLGQWGKHGTKPGQFDGVEKPGSRFGGPHFIALDSKGRLYTTEGCQSRVQLFSPDGKATASWGSKGQEPGGFGALKLGYSPNPFGPIAVFVDKYDRVWVSSLNDRVQCFTPEGKYLFGIGGSGKETGKLARPHGMAFDSKGHLFVCDAGNQRIQKFEIPSQ